MGHHLCTVTLGFRASVRQRLMTTFTSVMHSLDRRRVVAPCRHHMSASALSLTLTSSCTPDPRTVCRGKRRQGGQKKQRIDDIVQWGDRNLVDMVRQAENRKSYRCLVHEAAYARTSGTASWWYRGQPRGRFQSGLSSGRSPARVPVVASHLYLPSADTMLII